MLELDHRPRGMRKIAGFGAVMVLAFSALVPGKLIPDTTKGDVTDLWPDSAWGECDPNLWKHVHGQDNDGIPGPDRLEILAPCITVTGTIVDIQKMNDGDYHVLLKPDLAFLQIRLDRRFEGNKEFHDGNLVTEPVCASEIKDNNVRLEGVCTDFSQKFDIKVGQRVKMTGSYALDRNKDHRESKEWLEIHPITSIRKIK